MVRVALYLRISQDPKHTELGIERQREDCRALCARNGWTIVAEHEDNDKSGFDPLVKRSGYDALLADIKARRIDRIVTYKSGRLARTLKASLDLFELLLDNNVTAHAVSGGEIDLSTASGIAMAQMGAVMAEHYVRTSREDNLRKRRQIAEKGGRHKTARTYGWEDDGIKVRESEAAIVREMVDRILAGDSPTSIAAKLNERKVPTRKGNNIWYGVTVSKIASRASNAAIREHRGDLYYNGQWEPIIPVATWERVLIALDNGKSLKYKRGAGRKYLLTGFIYCECGAKLSATVGSGERKASYRCHKTRSHDRTARGCGQLSRQIVPLEDLVSKAILARLNSPELMQSVSDRKDDRTVVAELLTKRDEQQARIDNLITTFYTGKSVLDERQFNKAKIAAQDELDAINQQLSQSTSRQLMTNIDLTEGLEIAWEKASLSWRRNVMEMLIEKIIVHKTDPHAKVVYYGKSRFDPSLIEIKWSR